MTPLPDTAVLAKLTQVVRDLKLRGFKVVDDGKVDIWDQRYAQEFMHELMKDGDWHICQHRHERTHPEDGDQAP